MVLLRHRLQYRKHAVESQKRARLQTNLRSCLKTHVGPLAVEFPWHQAIFEVETPSFPGSLIRCFAARGTEADIEAERRLIRRDGGHPPEPDDRLPNFVESKGCEPHGFNKRTPAAYYRTEGRPFR